MNEYDLIKEANLRIKTALDYAWEPVYMCSDKTKFKDRTDALIYECNLLNERKTKKAASEESH